MATLLWMDVRVQILRWQPWRKPDLSLTFETFEEEQIELGEKVMFENVAGI